MQWEKLLSDMHYVPQDNMDHGGTQSDYDTIICSTLFRRLQDKAQVFPLDEDDYVKTAYNPGLENTSSNLPEKVLYINAFSGYWSL